MYPIRYSPGEQRASQLAEMSGCVDMAEVKLHLIRGVAGDYITLRKRNSNECCKRT